MRISQQAAFVLHTRPFSESSFMVELLTREHGRLIVLAKGARRAKSPWRGVLQAFQQLTVGWSGKGEMPTLTQAELAGRYCWLDYKSRVCGFYVNELVMALLQRHDPHKLLYDHYVALFEQLADNQRRELALRQFELSLLREIGYALILDEDAQNGQPINDELCYRYVPEMGPVLEPGGLRESPLVVQGKVLNSIARHQYDSDATMLEAKRFMRRIFRLLLGNKSLYSRDLLYLSQTHNL